MKLIDLLVQELPKRGGWNNKAEGVVQDGDDTEFYFFRGDRPFFNEHTKSWENKGGSNNFAWFFFDGKNKLSDDYKTSIVTREQYEAALAASQQPAWNGEGLPPVGTICEALAPVGKGELWSWQRVKVVESGIEGAEKECLVYNLQTTMPSWVDDFRPIRTEAERRREEVADSLNKLLGDIEKYPTWRDALSGIYALVAAGKVDHLKVEASDE